MCGLSPRQAAIFQANIKLIIQLIFIPTQSGVVRLGIKLLKPRPSRDQVTRLSGDTYLEPRDTLCRFSTTLTEGWGSS